MISEELEKSVAAAQTAVVAARGDATDLEDALNFTAGECEKLRKEAQIVGEHITTAQAALGTNGTDRDASEAASACARVSAMLRYVAARVELASDSAERAATSIPINFPSGILQVAAAPLAEAMADPQMMAMLKQCSQHHEQIL